MLLKVLVFGTFCIACFTTTFADFSWPGGRIPYLDDYALIADPDQAVALNNARMDLQVRTCIRFYPRRFEKDFVFFTDLGPQVECWNMFDHTKGRVEVNAGPSCLEPMRRPHRPKRVFSDCDIEYVNHLYHCPRRRRISSPICPMGQSIMSIPIYSTTTTTPSTTTSTTESTTTTASTMTTTKSTTTTTTTAITTVATTEPVPVEMESFSSPDEHEAKAVETSTVELHKEEEKGEDVNENAGHHEDHKGYGESKMKQHMNHGKDGGQAREEEVGSDEDEPEMEVKKKVKTIHPAQSKRPVEEEEEPDAEDSNNGREITAEEAEEDGNHSNHEEAGEEGNDNEESNANVVESLRYGGHNSLAIATEATPTTIGGDELIGAKSVQENMVSEQQRSLEELSGADRDESSTLPPTIIGSSTLLMMTLITTPFTTTTTIEPPTPDWVRSVEASFESHAVRNGEGNGGDGVESDGRRERGDIAIEIIDYAGAGASAMGIGNNFISATSVDADNGSTDQRSVDVQEARQNRLGGAENHVVSGTLPGGILVPTVSGGGGGGFLGPVLIGNGKSPMLTVDDGSGRRFTVSQTKVTTMIEKSNYVGPCGSACSYSGDLVKLYRSYNDKTEVNDHFYTTDRLEHHLMSSQGYMMQPYMGHLGRSHVDPSCSCLKPLYRLYNEFMKDHLLTSTEHEKDMAERILGYKFERVLGFCTKEPGCGAYVPLYRFYNAIAKDHLYTVDQQEMHYYRTHPEHAYGFENIECYVWQHNSSAKGCPALMLGGGSVTSADDFARL